MHTFKPNHQLSRSARPFILALSVSIAAGTASTFNARTMEGAAAAPTAAFHLRIVEPVTDSYMLAQLKKGLLTWALGQYTCQA